LLKIVLRIAALSVVVAGIILAIVYRDAVHPDAIRDSIAMQPLAPVAFILLQVAASLLFVPRTVLGVAAGLVFGAAWGVVWSIIGAIAGAAAGFAFARWIGAEGVLDRWPHVGPLVERAENAGWRGVAILRLTPVPHSVGNTVLALTRISWRDYLIGSALGMLPMTVAQVEIGASGSVMLRGQGNWLPACLLLAGGLLLSLLLKRLPRFRRGGERDRAD